MYQIKVTLKHFRPPIWRRIEVISDMTLKDLHHIIQDAMGWEDCHLHQFTIMGVFYGPPEPDSFSDTENENRVKLSKVVTKEKAKFAYEYDFGDSWEHEILVEKILPVDQEKKYPVCTGGKRACPPEDIGGVWGYAEFLEAIHDPAHPEHEDMTEWIGGDFDPEAFDMKEVNKYLQS